MLRCGGSVLHRSTAYLQQACSFSSSALARSQKWFDHVENAPKVSLYCGFSSILAAPPHMTRSCLKNLRLSQETSSVRCP